MCKSIIIIAAVLVVIAGGYLAIQRWMDHENALDLAYMGQLGTNGPVISRDEIARTQEADHINDLDLGDLIFCIHYAGSGDVVVPNVPAAAVKRVRESMGIDQNRLAIWKRCDRGWRPGEDHAG
jgi:hypothetical protein